MNVEQLLDFGPNAGYLTELYQLYKNDPSLVDSEWAAFFASLEAQYSSNTQSGSNGASHSQVNGHPASSSVTYSNGVGRPSSSATADIQATSEGIRLAEKLADNYRRFGHFTASLSPLAHSTVVSYRADATPPELTRAFYGSENWSSITLSDYAFDGVKVSTLEELDASLRAKYSSTVGFEYMHLANYPEREWLRAKIEGGISGRSRYTDSEKKAILSKLIEGDLFESELHRKYVGTKRFSLEGTETVIAALDALLSRCAADGVSEVVFGMAHRGRLNVLANTLGKPLEVVFGEFQDLSMATVVGAGDVKYHLGFEGKFTAPNGATVGLQMVPNPSHLEFVNPVVEGVSRAIQDTKYGADRKSVLPLLMHGDAAVAGQGIVFETMGYSLLQGYTTGGTVHIVINNQIGFTTTPDESRSTNYCTDFAKGFDCPIFHVNAEDPESACWVTELAVEFRNTFGKDVFVDLIGYRKHGHNEGDDPSFTQPLTYGEIKGRKPLWMTYGETLRDAGGITQAEIDELVEGYKAKFSAAQEKVSLPIQGEACSMHGRLRIPTPETGVDAALLKDIAASLIDFPQGFIPHPKLAKIIEKRVETVTEGGAIEWGVAEALAYGSLVTEGRSVRLSGQDCRRGTFSQRHIVLDHFEAPEIFSPIAEFSKKRGGAQFEVYNSSLSEAGVLGFEFGYGSIAQKSLVMWEAQFGDFSNGAQVIIDQFICSSEAKWGQLSGVTLLLPHAYEGQGPEHSSARLERYLQLCGEGNMSVCYPSTSAQQFHLLRRQGLLEITRPLVVMTPKSLLRLASASSPFEEFTTGSFKPVIEDDLSEGGEVSHIVMLTGKVYHDVMPALRALGKVPVKVLRIEQLHPFPQYDFKKSLKDGPDKRVIWVQEEPMNMGAWSYVQPYLQNKLGLDLTYVGRQVAASTATGSPKHHAAEQKAIVAEVVRLVSEGK